MEVYFNLDDITAAAATFLSAAGDAKVFAFHGEMGAGKTTFIHALCEALQVQETISSPTFSIINEYSTIAGNTIYHMDLYRIKDEAEAINAGIEDCLFSGNTCFVEWPEKAPGIFPDGAAAVHISIVDSNTRKITLQLAHQKS